ncbi:tyrosine kinase, putative, partial [Entamoeba invadens IP1]
DKVDMILRIKMMLDASSGILYLHENAILHRDIKPDNFLVFSLNLNDKVNAKLTDFGSARNVNLLMRNMTFTKEKHTKYADVFSFGITVSEVFKWCEAYSNENYKFPWKIADFVMSGKRLERKENIPETPFKVIEMCWVQEKANRVSIDRIVNLLTL